MTLPVLPPYVVHGNAHYVELFDANGLGVSMRELRRPGYGQPNDIVPVGWYEGDYADFATRTDLPYGTVVHARNYGQTGSYWRFDGTAWVIDRPFLLTLAQGSLATPVAAISTPTAAFVGFGSGMTPALGFWKVGRRLRLSANVIRSFGVSTTAHTQVRVGGVQVFDAVWAGTTREQRIALDLWVSGATVVTSTGTLAPGSVITGATPATADYTVANLDTVAQSLAIGINETVGAAGTYGLIDLCCEVLA